MFCNNYGKEIKDFNRDSFVQKFLLFFLKKAADFEIEHKSCL